MSKLTQITLIAGSLLGAAHARAAVPHHVVNCVNKEGSPQLQLELYAQDLQGNNYQGGTEVGTLKHIGTGGGFDANNSYTLHKKVLRANEHTLTAEGTAASWNYALHVSGVEAGHTPAYQFQLTGSYHIYGPRLDETIPVSCTITAGGLQIGYGG